MRVLCDIMMVQKWFKIQWDKDTISNVRALKNHETNNSNVKINKNGGEIFQKCEG